MSDLVCDLCKGLDKYMYIGKITKPAYCQNSPTENGCKLKHQGIRNCPIYTKKKQKNNKTNQPTKKKQQKKTHTKIWTKPDKKSSYIYTYQPTSEYTCNNVQSFSTAQNNYPLNMDQKMRF